MCCGLRTDKARVLSQSWASRPWSLLEASAGSTQPLHGPDAKVTGTVRLDSSTNKPTEPLNILGIFVASNSPFWDVPDAFPHQLELQVNRGTRLSLPCRSRVSALPVLSFAELAL
jgi:hypothetical protein